jgi:hypothetical protein
MRITVSQPKGPRVTQLVNQQQPGYNPEGITYKDNSEGVTYKDKPREMGITVSQPKGQ